MLKMQMIFALAHGRVQLSCYCIWFGSVKICQGCVFLQKICEEDKLLSVGLWNALSGNVLDEACSAFASVFLPYSKSLEMIHICSYIQLITITVLSWKLIANTQQQYTCNTITWAASLSA